MSQLYQEIIEKKAPIAVIGLGYVGLPLALAFAEKVRVIGFDINSKRIAMMRQAIDPSGELPSTDFEGKDILFTDKIEDLQQARFYIVAVPTPVDRHTQPDLRPLLSATETVGKVLKKGDYVVYESTVYPGCTEEDCVPILERLSGLQAYRDFKVGYSPERINPGDKEHTLRTIVKVVSACCPESLDTVARVYGLVVDAGVHRAPSIKVAEAAKVIENTQRDLNIALMNELSMIFDKMNINTYDVLEAAATKWNFLRFVPGLVGGHCIGVDPYYLTYKAKAIGHYPEVILSGRGINDRMAAHVAKRVVQLLLEQGHDLRTAKVLVAGITFKENVKDIRNSKVADLVHELQSFHLNVSIIDPHAESEEVEEEYGLKLSAAPQGPYQAIILAVAHNEYKAWQEKELKALLQPGGVLIDLKGIWRKMAEKISCRYWSL
jgi:UDP-N-acetyl-D-galactosamine dehydrogenase